LSRIAVLGPAKTVPLLVSWLGEHQGVQVTSASTAQDVEKAMLETDLAIGCWGNDPRRDQAAARGAISAGVTYISAGESLDAVRALGELREAAEEAGSLVVSGVSWSPGITNLMAAAAAAQVREPRRVRVAWVAPAGGPHGRYVTGKALDALSGMVAVFEDGSWRMQPPGGQGEEIFFPEPVGWRRVHLGAGAEVLTLPRNLDGVKDVAVKAGILEGSVDLAIRQTLGASSYLPARLTSQIGAATERMLPGLARLSPIRNTWVALRVDVTGAANPGAANGSEQTVTYGLVGQLPTLVVAPLVVAAATLAGGTDKIGIQAPESVFEPADFFAGLAHRGVRVARLRKDGQAAPTMKAPGP
jgi:hypothetical protein